MKEKLMSHVLRGLVPEFPDYYKGNADFVRYRLFKEGKASSISTNLPIVIGVNSQLVLLYLLRNSKVKRKVVKLPEMPGYLYLDIAKMKTKIVRKKWW